MLAGIRSWFMVSFLLALLLAGSAPVAAQVSGIPPSVTSIGFGGNQNLARGVPPSVTSLGPNGYLNFYPDFWNCCANLFMPANPNPPLFFEPRHHRRDGDKHKDRDRGKDHADVAVGVVEPAYIPYAVPYAPEAGDDSADVDDAAASGPRSPDLPAKAAADRDAAPPADDSATSSPAEAAPVGPQERLAAQPSTVLVFKDGRMAAVVNYAIVGETLFDFGDGRTRKILLTDLDLPATHKINDDRGVDFQVPDSTKQR
ncbi:MAG: hypothetical protein ACLPLR_03825 [Terriglobales bacterium]